MNKNTTPSWKTSVPVSKARPLDVLLVRSFKKMEEESEGAQNIQNENAFGDQMPLYPDDYDAKRTVSFFIAFLLVYLVQSLQIICILQN